MLHFSFFKRKKLLRKYRRVHDKYFPNSRTQHNENHLHDKNIISNCVKILANKLAETEIKRDHSYFQRCLDNITNILGNTKLNANYNVEKAKSLTEKQFEMTKGKRKESSSKSSTSDVSTIKSVTLDKKPAINKSFILRKLHKVTNDKSLGQYTEFKPKLIGKNNCDTRSSIYCTDMKNVVYNISFYTTDVRVFPLHLEKREGADFNNDKEVQSENHFFYKTKFFINSSKFIILKKFYFIPSKYKKKFDRLKGITPPVKVYFKTDSYKGKSTKKFESDVSCKMKYPTSSGEICLLWDNINIKVKAEMFNFETVKQNRMLNPKNEIPSKSYASIITRYKNDIIEFRFHMTQIQIQEISPNVSRSCQVRDSQAYIPYISDINNRRVILVLPFTQYFYKNPMTEIIRYNWLNALNKREPRWVTELRHLRQNKAIKEDFNAMVDRIVEQYHCTEMQINLVGIVYKIKGNVLLVKKLSSDTTYEMFAQERQRENLIQETGKLKSSNVIMNLIPDWNLEENSL